jgi:uncharacterized protein (TIRG00374 family)
MLVSMKRTTNAAVAALRVVFGLGLLYYVLVSTGSWRFGEQFVSSPRLAVGLLLWVCLGATLEAKRLALLLRSQGIQLPILRGIRLVAIATYFGFFVPGGTGGDLAKVYALAGNRPGQRVEVTLVVLADRAMGLLSLASLITILGIWNWHLLRQHALIRYLVVAACFVGTGLICGVGLSWSDRLRASSMYELVRTRIPGGRYAARVWDALYAFRSHRAALAAALGLSLIGHATLCGIFLLVGAQAVAAAPAREVCFLGLLGMLANALPLTPAGIGVGEAAFAGLFALAGYAGGSELILAWRVGSLPLCIAGGVLCLAGLKERRQPHAAPVPGEAPP